jgi:excisionase family DNA binding protein
MPTVGEGVLMALLSTMSKTLTPDQARAEYFPEMGRAAFYAALRRKEIPSLRLGRKFLIPRAAIEKFLENCGASAAGVQPMV